MIFPVNIENRIRNKGKTHKKDKIFAIFVIMVLLNVLGVIYVDIPLKGMGIPIFISFLVQLALSVLVVVTIIRIFVVREKSKMSEVEASKDSSLNTYYFLRNKDVLEEIDDVPVFEYTDGNFCIALSLYYGANSDKKSKGNRTILQDLINTCLRFGFTYRTYSLPEKFKESVECFNYTKKFSNIQDKTLREFMVDNLDLALDVCEDRSELLRTVILIKTTTPYQIMNFESVIRAFRELYYTRAHSFRNVVFMGNDEMRAFLRDYYCLEALDLSSLKSREVDDVTLAEFSDLIKVVGYNLRTGKEKVLKKTFMRNDAKRV